MEQQPNLSTEESNTLAALAWQESKGLGSEKIQHILFYQNFTPTPKSWWQKCVDEKGEVVLAERVFPYELAHTGMYQQESVNIILAGNPYIFHKEGSPYLGLSVDEQKLLAKIRRPVGRTPRAITRLQRKATREDYTKLLLTCVEGLIAYWIDSTKRLDRAEIFLKLPYNYQKMYKDSFPRVLPVAWEDFTCVVRIKIDKLINWMYDKGISPFDARTLRKGVWSILRQQAQLEYYYTWANELSKIELFDKLIKANHGNTISIDGTRSKKGRGEYRQNRPKKSKET